ncbi:MULTISPECIES: Uma2 family endonuclease [unclassified Nonomuraea]|uniref:Uma2 family endonuclease n=1 Tax=unclassified Nonomuraea TaxID=2593643 RepID=UPI0035BEFDA9
MTAEAVIVSMTPSSLPDWVFPPPEGFVAEDLDHIPDLPAHTELIDGSLVFVSPQRRFHSTVIHRLRIALEELTPEDHEVLGNMTVKLGPQQRSEPDLIVVGPNAPAGPEVTCFDAADVVLAVEVVSRASELRDRERKPVINAEAGIPHFWRIEEVNAQPAVFVYELDRATKSYGRTGIHHDRLKLTVPFDIDIDLTTLYKSRTR